MNNPLYIYGLIGYPIAHSRSPELFRQHSPLRTVAEYRLFPLEHIDDLGRLIEQCRPRGLNVTTPYKEAVLSYFEALELSPEVARLGAANVLSLDYDNVGLVHCSAYNTDVYGFAESLRGVLQGTCPRAIILGTGGAARAVALGLESLGYSPEDYCFISRTSTEPGIQVRDFIGSRGTAVLPYSSLEELVTEEAIIINASSVGINAADELALPYEALDSRHLCYDLNYRQSSTAFLVRCAQSGARCIDGSSMLRLQAEASWHIWGARL